MDSRDHINQSLYEILEEILEKAKRSRKLNPPSPEKSELEETKSNEKSLKTLLKAKENLNDLKPHISHPNKVPSSTFTRQTKCLSPLDTKGTRDIWAHFGRVSRREDGCLGSSEEAPALEP